MNLDSRSHTFEDPEELLTFITREVKRFTGYYNPDEVIYNYNRMTITELAGDVFIKVLRSSKIANKAYIRQAVMFVCIDNYRKQSDICESVVNKYNRDREQDKVLSTSECQYQLVDRLMTLKIFEPRELQVIELMMEGYRNPEIREILKIPKMTYYTLLNNLKLKYIDFSEEVELLKLIINNKY